MWAYAKGRFRRMESPNDVRPGEAVFTESAIVGVLLDVLEKVPKDVVERAVDGMLAED